MADRKPRTEALVGLFMLAGMIALGALIMQFGRLGERFSDHYAITVVFDDASGVIQGSDVRMAGALVGRVGQTPRLTSDLKVAVVLKIREDVRIPVGSTFTIGSASLLGDRLIIITPPAENVSVFIPPEGRVEGGGLTGVDAIQDTAVEAARSAERLFSEAEVTMRKVDAAVDDVRAAGGKLDTMLDKVNDRILSEKNLSSFENSLANLERATGSIESASDGLPDAISEARETFAVVREAADSAERTFASVTSEVESLSPAISELPSAIANVSRAAERAGNVIGKAEDGGILGVLTDDESTSADATEFIRNLRRYGILRYRDDASPELDDPRNRYRGRRR